MTRARSVVLACLLPLAACAAFRQERSWSDDLAKEDAVQIAGTIATLVAERAPPKGAKPVAIAPASGATSKEIEAQLHKALKERGYTLALADEKSAEMHHLRYLVTKYGGGYVLRVSLDGAEATTAFLRMTGGQLGASAPLAIREAVR